MITYEAFLKIAADPQYRRKQIVWAYQQTDRWLKHCEDRWCVDKYRCRLCDTTATHVLIRRFPDVLGQESIDDLTSLCENCYDCHQSPPSVAELTEKLATEARQNSEGANCPVCKTHHNLRNQSLYNKMCLALIKLGHLEATHSDEDGWIIVSWRKMGVLQEKLHKWEYQKLAFWGLIENKPRSRGFWRLTQKGRDFLSGTLKVPKKVHILMGEVVKIDSEMVMIQECLGVEFNYEELMRKFSDEEFLSLLDPI